MWLEEENLEKFCVEIPHYGIIDNKYYDTDSFVMCIRQDLEIKRLQEIPDLTKKDIEFLNENLLKIRNDKMQSLLVVCWALGKYHEGSKYPFLAIAATTSSGKSHFINNISKLLFGTEQNVKTFDSLTAHQVRSFASSSNITPLVVDEIKLINRKSIDLAQSLFPLFRSIFDGKTINKGNITNKLDVYNLCTPVIFSGETKLNDVSFQNRTVEISINPHNKSSFELFEKFSKTDILYSLGKKVLENRLEKLIVLEKNNPLGLEDDRQIFITECILKGLEALKKIIKIDNITEKEFCVFLKNQFNEQYTPEKNFKELLEMVLESDPYHQDYYVHNADGDYCRWQMLYNKIVEFHTKSNSSLELIDINTLKKQLLECGFIKDVSVNKRYADKQYRSIVFTKSRIN